MIDTEALFVVALGVALIPLADFGLLDVLDLLEVFGLVVVLVAGLEALVSLVTAAIEANGCGGVWFKVSVLYVTLECLNEAD